MVRFGFSGPTPVRGAFFGCFFFCLRLGFGFGLGFGATTGAGVYFAPASA